VLTLISNKKYDYVIVGSGLFGATCAYELSKKFKCLVIDKRSHIGGNCYTENLDGIHIHKYGAHIFHTSDKQIWNVLDLANLKHFVENLEGGLNFQIGENGNFLSGGQRQRLGLARALITSPQILVLDEATSSLDAETEAIVADALDGLKGAVTIIVVAHRLSSVKKADKLVYLKDGKIISVGTFDQVKSSTPEFEHQVKLLSL